MSPSISHSYIVYLGSHSFGPNPSSFDVEAVTNSHYDLLGSYVGSTEKAKEAIFYSYNRYINGFAAVLDEDEAVEIAKNPKVVSVFLNKEQKLHTTHSWDFLGLVGNGVFPQASIWRKTLGEDVIIGNIDTGVWPESKSFSDEGIGPIPKQWRGICQTHINNTQDKFQCNRKLIGARFFYKGYEAFMGEKMNASMISARDEEGHGSHTLSTAGGSFVGGASVLGFGNGTASGGSPKARVATYKACWPPITVFGGGCLDADLLAAIEAAISDGVHVLSMSLGSDAPPEYFQSAISIGTFHAVANGIIVVGSGGNSGPFPGTVTNNEPWMLTVAASTIDRDFANFVTLGNKKIFKGASLSEYGLPSTKMYPLIGGVDAKAINASLEEALNCLDGTLDPEKVKGKILLCLGGGSADKGVLAASVGAVGMILANDKSSWNQISADPHVLPASNVDFENGNDIYSYINSTKSPLAYISRVKTELGVKPAPFVASFSSRGPNLLEPAILKPDVTAPGVNIIAAYSEAISPTGLESDKRRTPYIAR
ncbi:Subtilisin-like protease SBT5.4, partial [Mucuna pruriens]